jgi:extracellular factor (EF) 3-hydroxypalmitic acid methyl ester biosynthesis protein
MEGVLETLELAAARLTALSGRTDLNGPDALHRVAGAVHGLCEAIGRCEAAGLTREEILARLGDVRHAHGRSPFIAHLQHWPRGYPGDFEAIERILSGRVEAPQGTLEHWLEYYALSCAVSQQHRLKVRKQADVIARVAFEREDARILVLACGSAPDLLAIAPQLARTSASFVLADMDPEALALSRRRLAPHISRVRYLQANVVTGLDRLRQYGPFDLVVAGGLFDYLPDRVATILLRRAFGRLLGAHGGMLFTNIATGNPYRCWIEYMGAWTLIERNEEQIHALLDAAGLAHVPVRLSRDATGLAHLVELGALALPIADVDEVAAAEPAPDDRPRG